MALSILGQFSQIIAVHTVLMHEKEVHISPITLAGFEPATSGFRARYAIHWPDLKLGYVDVYSFFPVACLSFCYLVTSPLNVQLRRQHKH